MLIGLTLLAFIIWSIHKCVSQEKSWVGKFLGITLPIVAGVLAHYIILLLFFSAGLCVNEKVYTKTTEMYAINDNEGFKGIFVLGVSASENQSNNIFYYKTKDNNTKLDQALVRQIIIYEYEPGNQNKPNIIEFKNILMMNKSYWWLFYFIPMNSAENTYEIHVPKGSIRSTFELDLK